MSPHQTRRQRSKLDHERALVAVAAGKECATAFVRYTQKREECLHLAQRHGLKRGIHEYEGCLERLQHHCQRLTATFRLGEPDTACQSDEEPRQQPSHDSHHQHEQPEGLQLHCNILAGQPSDAAARTPQAANPGSQQQPCLPGGRLAPPPPPPPLPVPGRAVPSKPAGAAPAPPPPPPPLPGMLQPGGRPAAARAPPPPPPGPPPQPKHVATAAPGLQGQPSSGNAVASEQPAGPGRAPPPPPGPPPPLPPGFKKATGLEAAGTGVAAQAAMAAAGVRRPAGAPPPPPPGPPPCAAALRGDAQAGALAGLGSKNSSSNSSSSAAGPPAALKLPPPPPPLPKQLALPAAATEGMRSLAAVAAAAAAAAAANNSSTGSGSPGAEQQQEAAAAAAAAVVDSGSQPMVGGLMGEASGKLKTLHVDPVPSHRLADGSFWKVADPVAKPFKDSMEYLLRTMFSDVPRRPHHHHHISPRGQAPTTPRGASTSADGAAEVMECEVVTCVPEKRALHVEVVLKRLHMPAAALAAAINLLNTDKLKPDDLASIRSILPKPEELQAVREAKQTAEKKAAVLSPRSPAAAAAAGIATHAACATPSSECCVSPSALSPRLGVVEAAFDALGGVELLQAKMRAMEFRYDVDTVASLVADYAADIGHSLDVLRLSGQLQYLLAFVRDVANTMNRAGPKGALAGFKLESLARLQSTKMAGATDLNLLHYIVAHLAAVLPGVLVLDAEREAFRAACRRGTFDAVGARVRTLLETQKRLVADLAAAKKMQQQRHSQQQLDGADPASQELLDSSSSHDVYVARLSALLDSTGPKVTTIQQQLEEVVTKFRWTAEYYCEEVKGQACKQQPVAFLTHFLELLDSLAATQRDIARLARVTSMLAEYVAAQQLWHQRQVLLQRDLEQQQSLSQEQGQGLEQVEGEEQEQQMLLQQQELLRQHLEANERLHKRGASGSSCSSDSPEQPLCQDLKQQQGPGHQHDAGTDSTSCCASSVHSSSEHSQLVDDVLQQPKQQQKPPCVPLLDLGSSTGDLAGAVAAVGSISEAPAVVAEVSWGSDVGPGSELDRQQQRQHSAPGPRCRSPLRQPEFGDDSRDACEQQHDGLRELLSQQYDDDDAASSDLGAPCLIPMCSIGVLSVGARSIEDDSGSVPSDSGQLAAEAAVVARRRANDPTSLSRSLDSSMLAATCGWHSNAAGEAGSQEAKDTCSRPFSAADPPAGSKSHQQQHKLGLRRPWRPAGGLTAGNIINQQQQRKAAAVAPAGFRKWTQQDAQVAQEAAAAAAAASAQAGRPRSASPPAAPSAGKPSAQQLRLDALRLRGRRSTPEQQQQQQCRQQTDEGVAEAASPLCVGDDARKRLARILQSSIDSQV